MSDGLSSYFTQGWGSFITADHRGSTDAIKAEHALFKQKMLIIGKWGACVDVALRDVIYWWTCQCWVTGWTQF